MFHIGQKVVCIKDHRDNCSDWLQPGETLAIRTKVYTIRGARNLPDGPGIYLNEIINPPVITRNAGLIERPFDADDFRPLIERRTDISVFRALLNPTDHNYELAEELKQADRLVPERTFSNINDLLDWLNH